MRKHVGAVSATEAVDVPCSVPADSASHAERATVTHVCGYNPFGIRLSVIMPFEDGFAIAGRYASGGSAAYGGGLALQKFATLENAQTFMQMSNPCTAIRWEAIDIDQFDEERR